MVSSISILIYVEVSNMKEDDFGNHGYTTVRLKSKGLIIRISSFTSSQSNSLN